MFTKIGAWIASLVAMINLGVTSPQEAKPALLYADEVPETMLIETIEIENQEIETIEIETITIEDSFKEAVVQEEHEGEIFEIEDSEDESNLIKALNATRVTVADKAVVYWDDICTTFDNLGDKIIFWN